MAQTKCHTPATHFARLRAELEHLGTAGTLTTDTHLAVLTMERGYILYSTDTDFPRFSGLRWPNSLAGQPPAGGQLTW